MRLRVHCDEMAYGGAAAMAAALEVDAVDHCNYISDRRRPRDRASAASSPSRARRRSRISTCRERAPVRALLEAGGMVALASDYNPGTSPCFNLQTVAYFGRKLFGLSARRGALRA